MEAGRRKAGKGVWAAAIFCLLTAGVLAGLLVYRYTGLLETMGQSESSSLTEESETPSEGDAVSSETASEEESVISGKDSFLAFREEAQAILDKMTLREKVGQVFILLCPAQGGEDLIREYQPGGICLNAENFRDRSKEEVIAMMEGFQQASSYGLLTCCDEEGGTVTRISRFPALRDTPYASPREVYEAGGMAAVEEDTRDKALLLKELGINTNLAPVADLSGDPEDFIYWRSFGSDPVLVSSFVQLSAQIYKENGIACVLKHFPGYGGNEDTHTGLAVDSRPYSEFLAADFLPFQAGIQSGAPMVLVNHTIVECMDPENPATLSPRVHEVLREELGFGGLILTDDLSMEAITQYTQGENPCTQAFLAGNDLLLCSSGEENFEAFYRSVEAGEISEKRLNESVLRILEWKIFMGIL